jgi:hypothetical protein
MADIGASNWNETDANNSDAAPDGFAEGMAPSGVNNGARAMMGAVKRFWNRINAVKTTGGTTSAYTLTYDVAPAAYANGEIISFVVNATNAAAATINVNALGAVPFRLFGGNLLAGALITDQITQARYNSSAGAFDILTSPGWVRLGFVDASAASFVTFASIPAAVNNLQGVWEFDPGTDNVGIGLQTAGADGNFDTGAADYAWWGLSMSTVPTSAAVADTSADGVALASGVDNGTTGCGGEISIENIQASTFTKVNARAQYLDAAGVNGIALLIAGQRLEADRITGIRFYATSGTITGKATLFASV